MIGFYRETLGYLEIHGWLLNHGIGRWIITPLTLSKSLFGYNYGASLFTAEPNRWGKV
jgi:hypothetical protein